MRIPASFYGPSAEVRDRAKEMARRMAAGATWLDVVGEARIDVAAVEALIVLSSNTALLDPKPHFFVTLAWETVWHELVGTLIGKRKRVDAKTLEATLFDQVIATDWGTLGPLTAPIAELLNPESRVKTLIEAATKWWDSFVGVGARYSIGLPEAARFTHIPNGLQYLLSGFEDVPEEYLALPMPASGPAPLLKYIRM
jgi:hypothetical protein